MHALAHNAHVRFVSWPTVCMSVRLRLHTSRPHRCKQNLGNRFQDHVRPNITMHAVFVCLQFSHAYASSFASKSPLAGAVSDGPANTNAIASNRIFQTAKKRPIRNGAKSSSNFAEKFTGRLHSISKCMSFRENLCVCVCFSRSKRFDAVAGNDPVAIVHTNLPLEFG